jgi:hypothetical protein
VRVEVHPLAALLRRGSPAGVLIVKTRGSYVPGLPSFDESDVAQSCGFVFSDEMLSKT